MVRKLLVAAMVVGLSGLAVAPAVASSAQPAARGRVFIYEIFYNSPGSDHGSNSSLNAEWVQLRNSSGHPITLTHWTLRDKAGHVFKFTSTFKLRAHQSVKIHTGKGSDTGANRYWNHGWYIWNNNGDTATLKSGSGSVKSRCSYSDPHEDRASKVC
jgi:hypothetical protein